MCVTAPMGQIEQSLFIDSEQRTFEHGGQCEVVVGKQQKPAKSRQILHRQLLGQDQAVSAGDRDAPLLERAQQFADEFVSPPHQHYHVAGTDRTAACPQRLTAIEPTFDRRRDRLRKTSAGFGDAAGDYRQCREIAILVGSRLHRRPQLDEPGLAGARSYMVDPTAVQRYSVICDLAPENRVDGLQYRLGRAKRDLQWHHPPFLLGRGDALFEMPPHAPEGMRVGSLKAVDRLLCVTDSKNCAGAVARTFTGEKLFGERGHDLPLLGVGVLCFVDQYVVEPAVELKQYPGRDTGMAQQAKRPDNEIFVIECSLRLLALFICPDQSIAEADQGAGRLDQYH